MATFSRDTVFKLKALGLYQLIFAVAGLGVTLWFILNFGFRDARVSIVIFVVTVLYLFSIYSSILCFQKNPKCLLYSSINQYFQLASFSIAGYAFSYVAGLAVNLGFDLTNDFTISLKLDLLSFWHVDMGTNSNVILVNLNLAALAVILIIDQVKKTMKQEMEEEFLMIGQELKEDSSIQK